MQFVVFSKALKDKSPEELIQLAKDFGIDGYDLCVRPEYPINPDNAAKELVAVARQFEAEGLCIPMVTGNFDLLQADHPTAEPIFSAMDSAGIRLFKPGYFKFDPAEQNFWEEVDNIRRILEGWQELGRKYNVRTCYHTHSNRCFSSNASMLSHLIRGFDPRYIGAYLDTAHMIVEGEEFPVAATILRDSLSIVSMKDVLLSRAEKNGHGSIQLAWVEAGQGMVDWTTVFETLGGLGFAGTVSIHCEFEEPPDGVVAGMRRETAFFRSLRERMTGA